MAEKKVYFPHLNGLRFIAASMVIIPHAEQIKVHLGIPGHWGHAPAMENLGQEGVSLFFVLSGFLITYLLLAEERRAGAISVRKFYVRRALRIWPLYFSVILAALFVWPHVPWLAMPDASPAQVQAHLPAKLGLYFTFFAGMVTPLLGVVPHASQTWSVGTEEQFYAIWPVLVRRVRKHRLLLMFSVVFGVTAARWLILGSHADSVPGIVVWRAFITGFQVDRMGVGGAFAVLLFAEHRVMRVLLHPVVGWLCIALVVQFLGAGSSLFHLHRSLYAPLYGLLIVQLAAGRLRLPPENRVLAYLGEISYGLYMLHTIAISLVLRGAVAVGVTSDGFVYPLIFAVTIGLAAASYRWLETPFLRWKSAFTVVPSGAVHTRPS